MSLRYAVEQDEMRRAAVCELMLRPLPVQQIVEKLSEQGWIVSAQQVRSDCKVLREIIERDVESRRKTLLSQAVARVERKLAKTEAAGDWSTNLGLEKFLAQLLGYGERDVTVNNNNLLLAQFVEKSYDPEIIAQARSGVDSAYDASAPVEPKHSLEDGSFDLADASAPRNGDLHEQSLRASALGAARDQQRVGDE